VGLHCVRLAEINTRAYGDCAITIVRWNAQGNTAGRPIPEAARATLVTVKDRNDWRLASIHDSFITGTAAAPGNPGSS
jgi:ketosteroid isomerase-like protein